MTLTDMYVPYLPPHRVLSSHVASTTLLQTPPPLGMAVLGRGGWWLDRWLPIMVTSVGTLRCSVAIWTSSKWTSTSVCSAFKIHVTYILTYIHEILLQITSLSQMLTTDPGDSEECYACKLLEVLIIHCHHSLMQVGGAGPLVSHTSECICTSLKPHPLVPAPCGTSQLGDPGLQNSSFLACWRTLSSLKGTACIHVCTHWHTHTHTHTHTHIHTLTHTQTLVQRIHIDRHTLYSITVHVQILLTQCHVETV